MSYYCEKIVVYSVEEVNLFNYKGLKEFILFEKKWSS